MFAEAQKILMEGIAQKITPGAAFAVARPQQPPVVGAAGNFTYDPQSPAVRADTVFDLASLTKVLATTAMAMLLHQFSALEMDTPVVEVIPEFDGSDRRRARVTMGMLLAHNSGLPGYLPLFEQASSREELLARALAAPLQADPMARGAYSDIGFIILGEALARIAGEGIDSFCQREFFAPLGMAHTQFNPPAACRALIPPTVNDTDFRHRIIQGEVHDENASVMGGISGHAGLFATAADVARFGQCMALGGSPLLAPEVVELFTRRLNVPAGSSRALGWDTPSAPSQAGKYFSPHSFGHLGYTGASLWVDGERKLVIVLLTNRTWPDRVNQAIQQLRPRFHDAIFAALEALPE